ncbi:WGxxGxxG family protein [Thermobacillus sp. ZCTH02-B1]|uniref:WGxxGxxG family protein n=1 Tax=Thermobacillus sp. ZCTH02-B1 TaxID=1858795 RepID=UPI0025F1B52C|nr:WGxxGxxG family protein [Thermobacillus sp. ZCTH02-B1]
MKRTLKGAVAATALMLALSSPVFAEGGVNGKTDHNRSAYTGAGTNRTNVYTNRAYDTNTPAPVGYTDNRDFRRYNVNADNNGLMDRTERTVRGTVRAAATGADNDFDWGWLGLLGLIGLAGLRGRMRETS